MTVVGATLFTDDVTCARGDLWQLGHHRLLCADATNSDQVARLFAGGRAQAVITDPPYGEIHADWDVATFTFIPLLPAVSLGTSTVALFCTFPFGFALHEAMTQSGYRWRWDLVWEKSNSGFLVSRFMPLPSHEHIFAYTRSPGPVRSLIFHGYEAGEESFQWRKTNESKLGDTDLVYSKSSLTHAQGHPLGKRWIRSILSGRKKGNMREVERTPHPTQKPLEVVTKLVLLLTNAGDLVYDPFLGSGTTLLAAEQTKRRCYGIEKSREYCTLILQRWQNATGLQAQLLEARR